MMSKALKYATKAELTRKVRLLLDVPITSLLRIVQFEKYANKEQLINFIESLTWVKEHTQGEVLRSVEFLSNSAHYMMILYYTNGHEIFIKHDGSLDGDGFKTIKRDFSVSKFV
jgi:hypothetical protein